VHIQRSVIASAVLGGIGVLAAYGQGQSADNQSDKAIHETLPQAKAGGQGGGANTMVYHGGPLILGRVNVYYIWYGNWSGNTATTILTNFASSIGGSPYFNINTTYYNGSGVKVSNLVSYVTSTTDNYSQGTSLSDAQIQTVVSSAISSGRLPKDTNGVYFVLTSADVTASSGFCSQYCGWHTPRRHRGFGHQICVHRQPGPLPQLMRSADNRTEWQCRRGRNGVHHRPRIGRSHDRSGSERLVRPARLRERG